MNKHLIVFFLVAIVAVHAFVKRDAPTTAPQTQDDFLKKASEMAEEIGNKLKEALDPEKLKKGLNEFVESANKAIDSMKPKNTA